MLIKLMDIIKILACAVVVAQLGGCIFVDHDHHYHDHPVPVVVYAH